MATTTVTTPNENMVLSSPIPNGLTCPLKSNKMDGLVVDMRDISNTKNAIA
jgi:hypothetical protein